MFTGKSLGSPCCLGFNVGKLRIFLCKGGKSCELEETTEHLGVIQECSGENSACYRH